MSECGETWCSCGDCEPDGELTYTRELGYVGS
jgi:hypothetical protein